MELLINKHKIKMGLTDGEIKDLKIDLENMANKVDSKEREV